MSCGSLERTFDSLQHSLNVVSDLLISDSQYPDAPQRQPIVAAPVILFLRIMDGTVDLYSETRFGAVEIEDVVAERVLATEPDAERTATEPLPDGLLRRSRLASLRSGKCHLART